MRGENGSIAANLVKGLIAGYVATEVMERVASYMYEHEEAAARQREDDVRQGKPPFLLAAEKTEQLVGVQLSDDQRNKLGMAYHWGLGLGAAPLYALLRHRLRNADRGQGLLFGTVFFLLVDEVANTIFGFAPPPNAWPWQAHARGLAAHLAYGVVADTALGVLDRVA